MTTACFLRYDWKESPAQRPLAFMTSKGTPHRRYLSVDPILIPCPCSGLKPAVRAASPTLSRNLDLVSGRRVIAALYANRWDVSNGSWLVDPEVLGQCLGWVCVPFLSRPVHILAFVPHHLGPGKVQHHHFEPVAVLVIG